MEQREREGKSFGKTFNANRKYEMIDMKAFQYCKQITNSRKNIFR